MNRRCCENTLSSFPYVISVLNCRSYLRSEECEERERTLGEREGLVFRKEL